MRIQKWFSLLFLLQILLAYPLAASIIKRPPAKTTEVTYKDLLCTDQEKAIVYEIISTMGETSTPGLIFKQSRLKEIGAQISHIHPLKFLSSVFTHPELKNHMIVIWNSSFKKNGFMDGLAPNMTREADKGKLHQYLKDFAEEVSVHAESIQIYFDTRDWDGLVFFLIQS